MPICRLDHSRGASACSKRNTAETQAPGRVPPLVDLLPGPGEWLGCLVVGCDERIDVLLQLLDGGEGGAVQGLALQDRKPCFDLIEPGRSSWDEMEMDIGVFLE